MGKKCCVPGCRSGYAGVVPSVVRELCVLEHVFSIPADRLLALFRVSERGYSGSSHVEVLTTAAMWRKEVYPSFSEGLVS
ncbi:Hypothetical protein FKW44_020069 [Caligus rogercresseyi]|uniref:Uncharacterized protein n=1 Tax=Caligus rogercresseyi TaxID=217165 RepID=A0A7T8JXY3_CALRO|nr:Hypothetical protein FKW44_020069 [Caligus rogercresseyi]